MSKPSLTSIISLATSSRIFSISEPLSKNCLCKVGGFISRLQYSVTHFAWFLASSSALWGIPVSGNLTAIPPLLVLNILDTVRQSKTFQNFQGISSSHCRYASSSTPISLMYLSYQVDLKRGVNPLWCELKIVVNY